MNQQVNELIRLYTRQQRGGGLDDNLLYYTSSYKRQRGAGLGSILGSLAKRLMPFAKQILWPAAKKYVLPHAKSAALALTDDILEGKNVGQSLKQRGVEAIKGATQQLRDQSGTGKRKKRTRAKPYKRKTKKKLNKTITLGVKNSKCRKKKL